MHRFLVVALCATVAVAAIFATTLILLPVALPDFLGCAIRESEQRLPVASDSTALPSVGQIVVTEADRIVQVVFSEPSEAVVELESISPGEYDPGPMIVPFRYNFPYDTAHCLTVSHLPGEPSIELRAVLRVAPPSPRARPYIEKTSIPFAIAPEDVDAVRGGDSITKVVFLPDGKNGGTDGRAETLTGNGPASRDNVRKEAERRGTLVAVLEIGFRGESTQADE